MTAKHAVNCVIPNLNFFSEESHAHSGPVKEIQRLRRLVLLTMILYAQKQLPLIFKGNPKRCFKKNVYVNLTSFLVEIALKI